MNTKQKAFLKTLQRSIDRAHDAQKDMFRLLELKDLDDDKKHDCLAYAIHLQKYVEAAEGMMTECQLAYGRNYSMIAGDAMKNRVSNN